MKTALVILAVLLFFGAGCLNLSNEAIIPSLIKHSAPSQLNPARPQALDLKSAPPDRTVAPVATLVSTDASAPAAQFTAISNTYVGLELLNIQVGNARQRDLARYSKEQINFLSRQVVRPSLAEPGRTQQIVFQYIDQAGPLDEQIAHEPAIKTLLASAQDIITRQQPKGSINLIRADRVALALVDSVKRLSSNDPGKQKDILDALRSIQGRAAVVSKATQANETPPAPTEPIKVSLDAIIVAYLDAYIRGDYRDRSGTLISQPDLSKNIGADTVTAFESVILDAIFDYATLTPIVYDPKPKAGSTDESSANSTTAPTTSSKLQDDEKPTFAVLFPDLCEPVEDDPHKGITSDELTLIQFLGGIGGEQSKHISSAVIRLFGGASFVAKLSVGDNDTISKSVSTFFQEVVERTVGTVGYDFFSRFSCTVTGTNPNKEYSLTKDDLAANRKNLGIGSDTSQAVVDAVQYQQLLNQLFLPKKK